MTDKQQLKQERYRKFQEAYTSQLPQKLVDIHESWQAILKPSSDLKTLMFDFRRQVHSLAGSAGSFGFRRLGKQALELELLLNKLTELEIPSSDNQKVINQYLSELNFLAEQEPEVKGKSESNKITPAVKHPKQEKFLIYIIEDDELFCQETAVQLQRYGYDTASFTTINEAETAIKERRPSAMVIDIDFPEGHMAGPQLAKQFQSLDHQKIPVIFMSARDDWEGRLAAVRADGEAYLTKPFDFIMLVDRLDLLLEVKEQQPYRIMIVDDVAILAEHYAYVLQMEGMSTHIVNDPARLLDDLQEFKPDLVLMDIYMPGVSGIEAAKVIRQKDIYQNIPIVYLSTESGLDRQLEALRLGGDDFLQKPIRDEHLASAVKIRVGRFRDLSALMIRDSLTGLLNHIALKLELDGAIAQSIRNNAHLAFVMLDIDHFKDVNDQYGHPVGDRVIKSLARLLQQRLRKSDVVGRYGGEEFAIILPDTEPEIAKKVLDKLRDDFSKIKHSENPGEFTVSFSAGISSVSEYKSVDALINAADEGLYKAKHAGRNCTMIHKAS